MGVELHCLEVPYDELWRGIEAWNSAPPWDKEPTGRADVDEWLTISEVPDAEELALFDSRRSNPGSAPAAPGRGSGGALNGTSALLMSTPMFGKCRLGGAGGGEAP